MFFAAWPCALANNKSGAVVPSDTAVERQHAAKKEKGPFIRNLNKALTLS
jgi:hypothetical protein